MKHLALAAALSVAMPVQASWWDDMGQCSDAVSDATRRYQVAQESHVEEMENRIAELESKLRVQTQISYEMQDRLAVANHAKWGLERRNAILQEQLDLMAAKYRPQEQTAPFDYLADPDQ